MFSSDTLVTVDVVDFLAVCFDILSTPTNMGLFSEGTLLTTDFVDFLAVCFDILGEITHGLFDGGDFNDRARTN